MTRGALGLAVAAALLWLLFRGTDWDEVAGAIRGVDLGWLGVAQLLLWGSYLVRAQRWGYVVRAVHPASFRSLLSATQIGFLVNFTIPARVGELVRAYVLSRLVGIPVARSLAMVALDRVNDVIGVLAVLLVAAAALTRDADVEFPPGAFGNQDPVVVSSALIRAAAWSLGAVVVIALAGLILLYVRREPILRLVRRALGRLSPRFAERTAAILESFAEGMHVFRSGRDLTFSLVGSLVTWGANVAALAAIIAAFQVDCPWYTSFLGLAMIAVFISVPVTPGTVGQYHLPAVAALLMAAPEVAPARAKAVAIVAHISTLIPIAGLGIYCLLRERLGLLDLVRRSEASKEGTLLGSEPGASTVEGSSPRGVRPRHG
jgi:uncharacterized protein (TIRG00374 family)